MRNLWTIWEKTQCWQSGSHSWSFWPTRTPSSSLHMEGHTQSKSLWSPNKALKLFWHPFFLSSLIFSVLFVKSCLKALLKRLGMYLNDNTQAAKRRMCDETKTASVLSLKSINSKQKCVLHEKVCVLYLQQVWSCLQWSPSDLYTILHGPIQSLPGAHLNSEDGSSSQTWRHLQRNTPDGYQWCHQQTHIFGSGQESPIYLEGPACEASRSVPLLGKLHNQAPGGQTLGSYSSIWAQHPPVSFLGCCWFCCCNGNFVLVCLDQDCQVCLWSCLQFTKREQKEQVTVGYWTLWTGEMIGPLVFPFYVLVVGWGQRPDMCVFGLTLVLVLLFLRSNICKTGLQERKKTVKQLELSSR